MRKMIFDKKKEPCTDVRQAQGMVEFALVLPILLLLVFGIIEFGRLLFMFASVTSASREAARYGAAVGDTGGGTLRYQDCDGIVAAASRIGVLAGITDVDLDINYEHYDENGILEKNYSCQDVQDVYGFPIILGDRIVITVTKQFQPIVPLVNIPAIPISATTARTIIRDVGVKGTPLPTRTKIPTLTPTETLVPTITETPKKTDKNTPTATPTATNTPVPPTATVGPSPTEPGPPTATPIPGCDPATYSISPYLRAGNVDGENSVYLGIENTGAVTLTINRIAFNWPPPIPNVIPERPLRLSEIRFDGQTGEGTECDPDADNPTTCIWTGNESEQLITESFQGSLEDRQLAIGDTKELRFVFIEELLSSFSDKYKPNPFPYNVSVVFDTIDSVCVVEGFKANYIHP